MRIPIMKSWRCWGAYYLDLIHDGKMHAGQILEMGDIVAGKVNGRTSEEDILLFTTGGMPVEDAAWAYEIYQNALKRGIGTRLKLWDVPAMV